MKPFFILGFIVFLCLRGLKLRPHNLAHTLVGNLTLQPRQEVDVVECTSFVGVIFVGFEPFVKNFQLLFQVECVDVSEALEERFVHLSLSIVYSFSNNR